MDNRQFRVLFYRLQNAANKKEVLRERFNRGMAKRYGFTYSDKDIDGIIDCLDYGVGKMSFKKFRALMEDCDPRTPTPRADKN